MRTAALLILMVLVAAALIGWTTGTPAEAAWHLAIGWLAFLARTASRVTVNWSGVATAAACLSLLLVGGQRFLNWLAVAPRATTDANAAPSPAAAGSPRGWPLKRTVQLLAIFMLLFMAGTAFIGFVHQAAWLATSPEPLTRHRLVIDRYGNPSERLRTGPGFGFQGFISVYHCYPPNGAVPEWKQASHSWQTRLLPFVNTRNDNIDLERDWDDPKNAAAFRRFVPQYLNQEIGVLREARGYAVSHYAGNSRWFAARSMASASPADGQAQTIVCGEVAAGFMPWGDPANVRDPADGINRSASSFGGPDGRGANFLMADGSVRFLSSDAAPAVLSAFATPDDGKSNE